jgi:hypothetical protein
VQPRHPRTLPRCGSVDVMHVQRKKARGSSLTVHFVTRNVSWTAREVVFLTKCCRYVPTSEARHGRFGPSSRARRLHFQGGDRRELDAEAGNMSVSFNTHEHYHQAPLSYASRGSIPAGFLRPRNPCLLGCCTTRTALHHVLQTAQPQVWVREVWLDAVCSPRKCLPKARSYLGGLNASSTGPFVGIRRLCDPCLGISTQDTNRA